jgi:hypothetical protein
VLLKVKHSLALTLKTCVVQFFDFVTYNLWFWVVFLISEIKILPGLVLLRSFRITKPLTLNPKPLKLCNQKNICFKGLKISKELAVFMKEPAKNWLLKVGSLTQFFGFSEAWLRVTNWFYGIENHLSRVVRTDSLMF